MYADILAICMAACMVTHICVYIYIYRCVYVCLYHHIWSCMDILLHVYMLKMRFKRCGRKRQPIYRIVVMSSTSGRDGRAIQQLGFYNPLTKETSLDIEQIVKSLNTGVQPTKTVKNLLKAKGAIN